MDVRKYKLCVDTVISKSICGLMRDDGWVIPFDPANTDYQRFKTEVNADEAQLQDADGIIMTSDEAKAFVATLP